MKRRETNSNGKGKITIAVFQLEGNDQTLQDGIRTVGSALTQMLSYRPPSSMRLISEPTALEPSADKPVDHETDQGATPQAPEDTRVDSGARRNRPLKNPAPIAIEGLDTVDVPLSDFAKGKKADSDLDRALVCVAWLKAHLKLNEFKAGHIAMGFKAAPDWVTPNYIPQVLSDMKTKKHWIDLIGRGTYALAQGGELALKQMAIS